MKTDLEAPAPDLPPDEPTRKGKAVTILVMALATVVGALWVIGPYVFAGRDDPTAIDSGPVRRAVAASCTKLRADLAALPAGQAAPEKAEAENRTVVAFIDRIRAVGPKAIAGDAPVEQWLGDWEHLVALRREALRDGKRLVVPIAGGAPMNIRMFELVRSGLSQCDVPTQLLGPHPGEG